MKVSVKKLKHIIKEEMTKMGNLVEATEPVVDVRDINKARAELGLKSAEEIKQLVLGDDDLVKQLSIKIQAAGAST
jgi:hypothetical protein|tara:strand:- start:1782 stop:2009 length:228 start_codon:yes stop_codon:yes gene_type:complete